MGHIGCTCNADSDHMVDNAVTASDEEAGELCQQRLRMPLPGLREPAVIGCLHKDLAITVMQIPPQ